MKTLVLITAIVIEWCLFLVFDDVIEITNNHYRQFVNWVRDSLAYKITSGVGLNNPSDTTAVNWKKLLYTNTITNN